MAGNINASTTTMVVTPKPSDMNSDWVNPSEVRMSP